MQRVVLFSLLFVACFAASCHHHKKEPKAVPALTIEVATAEAEELVMRYEFVTHLKSNYDAIIQPRVNGYLLKKSFSAGMPVRKGDLLFVLDADLLNTLCRQSAVGRRRGTGGGGAEQLRARPAVGQDKRHLALTARPIYFDLRFGSFVCAVGATIVGECSPAV